MHFEYMDKVSHPVTNSTHSRVRLLQIKRFSSYAISNEVPQIYVTFEIDPFHFTNASPMNTGNFLIFARSLACSMFNNLNCFELITFDSHSYFVTFVLFCLRVALQTQRLCTATILHYTRPFMGAQAWNLSRDFNQNTQRHRISFAFNFIDFFSVWAARWFRWCCVFICDVLNRIPFLWFVCKHSFKNR